jgi:hypothetical protein
LAKELKEQKKINTTAKPIAINEANELADWFVKNKIVEHLFGPNLHVEVKLKRKSHFNFFY